MIDVKKLGKGLSDFQKMILTDNYLVDKTMLIKELIEANDEVTLITRPRRFGETMNITMLLMMD